MMSFSCMSMKARASISKEEEAQLDKLMAAADDGFGNLFKENDVEGAEFYETLQTAMNLMGSSGNDHMTSAPTACNSESMEQFVAMTNRLMYNEKGMNNNIHLSQKLSNYSFSLVCFYFVSFFNISHSSC